ncbi:MAG: crotonase/enoyl-CoA hydratase family protein [Polyangiaceae bacterium]|nr:crotonase/enoyl-CoA hydratase family protein [Polyangiaceae bacterium]MCW5791161.1 crotonase/enoyl-CoA hydratase family protein [Polyangiaceae bacterium]
MSERVGFEVSERVAEVWLNRPEKLNALDLELLEGLVAVGEQLGARADVRAVVLRGEGRSFSAGLDFMSFAALGEGAQARMFEREGSPANRAQRAAWIWRELEVPVVAALQGHVFGGGLQIALGADLRIAAPDAQLSIMEIAWGLVPDMSGTRSLLGLVRTDVLCELVFSGRVLGAAEAAQLGLVTRVADDPLAAARELARQIAAQSPDAIAFGKQLIHRARELDHAAGLELEATLQRRLIGSTNQLEAVTAKLSKRAPEFRDRER